MPHSSSPPRRLTLALILGAIIAAGLVWRLVPLGLPPFALKYGGSILWGALVYVLVLLVTPALGIARAVLAASLIACAVEFSRLVHNPQLDAFRLTLTGQLLLGRVFSWWNLVAYAAGMATAGLIHQTCALRARRHG